MTETKVSIKIEGLTFAGDLATPDDARGIVFFVHGTAEPPDEDVIEEFHRGGLATLVVDKIPTIDLLLLSERVTRVVDWLASMGLRIGLYGVDTGAAAAMHAAARRPDTVAAVVSCGGRPDLARDVLGLVTSPTLLIVGGRDVPVVGVNRSALNELHSARRIWVVPGASHTFEERGALGAAARAARAWFEEYLSPTQMRLPHGEPMSPA